MASAPVFISHRAEYARIARALKKIIEVTSQGQLDVFISEDIPRGNDWREAIEAHLNAAQSLFLIYGAPYEDWSWCFYETGYFAAIKADPAVKAGAPGRQIYCLTRPDVAAPGPLAHLQMVTGTQDLTKELMELYERNNIDFDATELRADIAKLEKGLFGPLRQFDGYARLYLTAQDADFTGTQMPASAMFTGDRSVLGDLFSIGSSSVAWADVVARNLEAGDPNFMSKWIDETADIIMAARASRFETAQTVLFGRGGRRYRTLLAYARTQGDGTYCCEFLVIDEVGGPATGLTSQQLSLFSGIRMGYRFRSDVINKFSNDFDTLSEQERRARIQEIPRTIEDLTIESRAHGNINMDDFLAAFDDAESDRMRRLIGYWPTLKRELYRSLGLAEDGKTVTGPGLTGGDLERYRTAFGAMRLLNIEFLSRCCGRVALMMKRSEQELSDNARKLEEAVRTLTRPDLKTAA